MNEGPNIMNEFYQPGGSMHEDLNISIENKRREITSTTLEETHTQFIDTLIDDYFEKRTVVNLERKNSKLPGRTVILYGGGIICLFTLSYK